MSSYLFLIAQQAADPKSAPPPGIDLLVFLPAIALLFYFLLWRPMQKQERERDSLRKSIKKNDKILTNSGIYGVVVSVSDTEDEMVVRVDDNVKLKMVKSVVLRNLSNEEEAANAAKEAKEGVAPSS